jgi:hypothetical protein
MCCVHRNSQKLKTITATQTKGNNRLFWCDDFYCFCDKIEFGAGVNSGSFLSKNKEKSPLTKASVILPCFGDGF